MKEVSSYLILFFLIVIVIYYILNIREYGIREGARSGRSSNRNYLTQEQILNKINGNTGEINKLKKRLKGLGNVKDRLNILENKTQEMPEN
jgi:hypothetical protein